MDNATTSRPTAVLSLKGTKATITVDPGEGKPFDVTLDIDGLDIRAANDKVGDLVAAEGYADKTGEDANRHAVVRQVARQAILDHYNRLRAEESAQ